MKLFHSKEKEENLTLDNLISNNYFFKKLNYKFLLKKLTNCSKTRQITKILKFLRNNNDHKKTKTLYICLQIIQKFENDKKLIKICLNIFKENMNKKIKNKKNFYFTITQLIKKFKNDENIVFLCNSILILLLKKDKNFKFYPNDEELVSSTFNLIKKNIKLKYKENKFYQPIQLLEILSKNRNFITSIIKGERLNLIYNYFINDRNLEIIFKIIKNITKDVNNYSIINIENKVKLPEFPLIKVLSFLNINFNSICLKTIKN
jgi:hypothetical protein